MLPNIKLAIEKVKEEYKPDNVCKEFLGLIYKELKKGTRFGFTPNHKNTFGVVEAVNNTGMFASNYVFFKGLNFFRKDLQLQIILNISIF